MPFRFMERNPAARSTGGILFFGSRKIVFLLFFIERMEYFAAVLFGSPTIACRIKAAGVFAAECSTCRCVESEKCLYLHRFMPFYGVNQSDDNIEYVENNFFQISDQQ